MFAAFRRPVSLFLCLGAFGWLPLTAAAQSRDPLPEVRQRLQLEAQRIEKEIRDGRMRAYRLFRSDANEALAIIKGLIGTLRKDSSLSDKRHEALMKTLERDIDNLRALSSVTRTTDAPNSAVRIDTRRAVATRGNSDAKSVVDTAASRINAMRNRVAENRKQRDRGNDRYTGALVQIDKTAVPAAGDYELPKDWAEKSKKRSTAAKLSERERAILKALKKPVDVDYNMETFQSVIDNLSKQMGQNILTDKRTLEEAGITYDSPITLRFNKKVSARTALKRVLADVGLTYVIRKENIEVTTIARAKEMMTTRTYYIGDLIGIANPMYPAIANQFQMIQAIGAIISNIQGIDPESWSGKGGPGSITFDPVRMVLVIKQSAEMHYMLGDIGQ